MDIDIGYAHLFVNDPRSHFTDNKGHALIGTYEAQVDYRERLGNHPLGRSAPPHGNLRERQQGNFPEINRAKRSGDSYGVRRVKSS